VLVWLVFCCPSLSSCRTAKRLVVADCFSQYSLSLLCFVFVTVSLFGDILLLYETLVQFSLHFCRDGTAMASVCNWDRWGGWVEYICFVCNHKSLGIFWNSGSKLQSFLCLKTNIFFKSTYHRCGDCQIVLDYRLNTTTLSYRLHGTQVFFS
jgi:hypothetical protein